MKKTTILSLKKGIIIFLMMKFLYFFCIITVTASLTSSYSQTARLSLDLQNETLEKVLSKIEKETKFFFFYKNEDLSKFESISIKKQDASIYEVLDQLLADSGLTYKIIDEYIAIVPGSLHEAGELQQNIIKGIVTDLNGDPLPGVTVSVKDNPSVAVATDLEGIFSIEARLNDVLVFTFIGMKTKEVPVEGMNYLEVLMEEDILTLDDVIVIAYGVTKRETFTGSASVVSSEQISERPVSSFTETLAENATGVLINSTSQPGTMPTVRIRGIGSMNASNAPLYVIDGIAVDMSDIAQLGNISSSPLTSLNPNDIKSVTILKDAAASSLYGSRAANGVIIITTKQGYEGKTRYNLEFTQGVSEFAYLPDVVNKDEFAELWSTSVTHMLMRSDARSMGLDPYQYIKDCYSDQSAYNDYVSEARAQFNNAFMIEGQEYDFWRDGYDMYPNTDWLDEVTRLGRNTKVNLSASGGQKGVTYFASGEYYNDLSPINGAALARYSGRLNISAKTNDLIWFGANLNLAYTDQSGPQSGAMYANPMRTGSYLPPVIPVKNSDGSYNSSFPYNVLGSYNPVAIIKAADFSTISHRSINTVWGQLNLSDDLYLKSTFGYDVRHTDEGRWYPPGIASGIATNGIKYQYFSTRNRITSSTLLNYTKTFNEVHNVLLLAGWEATSTKTKYFGGETTNYQTGFTPAIDAGSIIRSLSGHETTDALLSALGKAEYNYMNKYYVSFSLRRDGSSRFSQEARWGNFWSVSGAWRLSEESFMDNVENIDDAKLRASYGINGTLPSGLYEYIGSYIFGNDYYDLSGASVRNVENLYLSWEKNRNLNIGAEISALNGRLFASIEYFNRYSEDLLLDRELSRITGYTTATVNEGVIRNTGFEYSLILVPIKANNFVWKTSINLSTLQNKIEMLPSDNVSGQYIDREGYAYNSWYMAEWAGIDKETGVPMWYNVDDNGDKTLTKDFDEATRQIFGNKFPHYYGSFRNDFNFKGLTISALLSFGWDFNVFDYDGALITQDDGYSRSRNKERVLLDNWRPDNTDSDNPILIAGLRNGSNYSTRYLYKGDYLKLKNVTINYDLPGNLLNRIGLESASLYVQANNLFILTHMPNFDPESKDDGRRRTYDYPTTRSFNIGVKIGF